MSLVVIHRMWYRADGTLERSHTFRGRLERSSQGCALLDRGVDGRTWLYIGDHVAADGSRMVTSEPMPAD